MVLEAGKEWVAKAKHAETAREAGEAMGEGIEALLELYQQFATEPVSGIVEMQRGLRSAPVIQLDTPAIVLVGVPNVGYDLIPVNFGVPHAYKQRCQSAPVSSYSRLAISGSLPL